MQYLNRLTLALFCCAVTCSALGQNNFNSCSAAFLDNKMVVNEYSPTGKCTLPIESTGKLTVCTADLSPNESKAVDRLKFMVAIRDKNTKTMVMYSNKTYKQLDIRKVLSKCSGGDSIVLLTTNNKYALPHNEVLVEPERAVSANPQPERQSAISN